MLHVLPVNDIKEHTEESTCECCPTVIIENGEMICIHNAYDLREIGEEKAATFKVGEKALRRKTSCGVVHDTWVEFLVNETYLELIAEFPDDYKKLTGDGQ